MLLQALRCFGFRRVAFLQAFRAIWCCPMSRYCNTEVQFTVQPIIPWIYIEFERNKPTLMTSNHKKSQNKHILPLMLVYLHCTLTEVKELLLALLSYIDPVLLPMASDNCWDWQLLGLVNLFMNRLLIIQLSHSFLFTRNNLPNFSQDNMELVKHSPGYRNTLTRLLQHTHQVTVTYKQGYHNTLTS